MKNFTLGIKPAFKIFFDGGAIIIFIGKAEFNVIEQFLSYL